MSRLKTAYEFLRFKGIIHTQADVATKMKAADVTISRAFNGHEKYLTMKFLRRFNSAFNNAFNYDWLANGTGEMLAGPEAAILAANNHVQSNVKAVSITDEPNTEELYLETKNGMKYYAQGGGKYILRVPLVPYDAYASIAKESELQVDRDEWEEVDFEVSVLGRGNYMGFNVRGDSMDDGTRKSFAQGEIVLVRELDKHHWRDGLRINRYPYWVIAFDNSILLKQIIDQDMETGDITCHSLNPSPEFRDFTINLDDVQRIFYIVKKKTPDTAY